MTQMTTRSTPSHHDFADCSALYQEAVQNGDPTRLCPPSVRVSAAVSDTIALAILHPQHDDAIELAYATITHRSDDNITATILDRRRIIQPHPAFSDDNVDDTQETLCTLHDGDTIQCSAKHIGWVVDKAAIRKSLGWDERRSSVLEAIREREQRESEFDAAREECTFEKGSAVAVDAATIDEEQKQWKEELKKASQQRKSKKKSARGEDDTRNDAFDYYV